MKSLKRKISNSFIYVLNNLVYVYVAFILIIGLCSLIDSKSENTSEYKADGFTISSYNVVLDVKKDNKVKVTENIATNFTSSLKHGIYKYTPLWLEYTGKNNKTIKRKAVLTNYRAEGDPYTTDKVNGKERIRIGSASSYVPEGEKDYTIKYTYDMGQDPYIGFDEFIFHAYGDFWGTQIKNATIQVIMPKKISNCKVSFYTDKYRKNNVTDIVEYTIEDNILYATFNEEKNYQKQLKAYCKDTNNQDENGKCQSENFDLYYEPLEKSLTVDIELPEGYFVGGSWNYGWKSFITAIIIILLTLITILKWLKYGKDHPKNTETVEFYPPDNLTSAEVGYVFNHHQSSKKYTIALLIQLASKGYIKIDEKKDADKNIEITNLLIKPKEPKKLKEDTSRRVIDVKKLKDDDENLNQAERTVMIHLFKNGDEKTVDDADIDKFLAVKEKLLAGGYIEIISDNDKYLTTKREQAQSDYDKEFQKYQQDLEKYNAKIADYQPLSKLEQIVYDQLFSKDNVVILQKHKTFYQAFKEVEDELDASFKDKVHDKQATKQFIWALVISIIVLILSLLSYFVLEDLDPRLSFLYNLSFICIIVNLFFMAFMKRKTEYGEQITAKVKGFRNFLITAEKSKLEALVQENPHYFYNILPYTYALNISKKWIKKFEDISMPEVDMGNFDYSSSYSYYSLYDNVYYPPATISSSSSSGGCGGGCSSCGGGCSSCGGGGSW